MKTLLFALLIAGCGKIESFDPPEFEPKITFDPIPELAGVTDAGAERIRKATGRKDVLIEFGGIPIFFEEDLVTPKGEYACALTVGKSYVDEPYLVFDIEIMVDPTPDPRCTPLNDTVLHEIVHSLNPPAEHSESGVFHEHGGARLEETSLGALCDGFECLEFAPE